MESYPFSIFHFPFSIFFFSLAINIAITHHSVKSCNFVLKFPSYNLNLNPNII